MVKRFDIYLIQLNPTQGSEIRKTHPCVIISPNEMSAINTVMIAPVTNKGKQYPTRVPVNFQGKNCQIVLDQIRTVDKTRLVKQLGKVSTKTGEKSLAVLKELFAK